MHKECEKHFPLFPTVNYISKIGKDNFRSISVSLKRLEKQGFIEKRNDENDMRISHIYINEKGRTALKNIHEKLFDNHKKMLSGFSEEEAKQLRTYLDRIIFNATGESDYSYKRPHDFKGDEECEK